MLGPGRDVQIWPLLGEGVRIANLCCLWTLSKERHWFLTFVPRWIKQKSPWGTVGCHVATLALVLLGEGSSSSSSSRSQSAPHWSSWPPSAPQAHNASKQHSCRNKPENTATRDQTINNLKKNKTCTPSHIEQYSSQSPK